MRTIIDYIRIILPLKLPSSCTRPTQIRPELRADVSDGPAKRIAVFPFTFFEYVMHLTGNCYYT